MPSSGTALAHPDQSLEDIRIGPVAADSTTERAIK